MNTLAFSTRSEYKTNKQYPHVNGWTIIGLDMGYSAPKCLFEHGNFVFPNFVKRLTGELFGDLPKDALIYEDKGGNVFIVGDMAMKSLTEDSVVSEDELFGRNHYLHAEFKVTFETAIGLALWNEEETDGHDVFLEMGLPPAYKIKDEPYLRSVVCKNHKFKLTKGGVTKEFDITFTDDNVDVMSQPMGTLNSLLFNDDGSYSPYARELMNADVALLDGGFVTLDKFLIRAHQLEFQDSDAGLGMKRILEELRSMLLKEYGVKISIPAMQKVLKTGKFTVNDLVTMSVEEHDIADYFEEANNKVAALAFDTIKDYVFGVKFLIMTGGIGEAWYPYFTERLKNMPVKVLLGKENSNLPTVYTNARGYYMYRVNMLKRGLR